MDSDSRRNSNTAITPTTLSTSVSDLPTISTPVLQTIQAIRISEALKEGDYQKLLNNFNGSETAASVYLSSFGTLLHLAASFGTREIFEKIMHLTSLQSTDNDSVALDVNMLNSEGNTALHIAAKLNRHDLVDILLNHPEIDDTIKNNSGKTPMQLTRAKNVVNAIEHHRAIYVSDKIREIHEFAARNNWRKVKEIFEIPKNRILVDINCQDSHGNNLLHLATKKDDVDAAKAYLELGVDPFMKNSKGKLPIELTKNENLKSLLKEAPMVKVKDLQLGAKTRLEGELFKWTNYASGYKRRWFVLEDCVLSYFKSQSDYPFSCRGSIDMKFAKVWVDPSDRYRFDVLGISNSLRYHLRAGNASDAKRWVVALSQAKMITEEKTRPLSASELNNIDSPNGFERIMNNSSPSPTDSVSENITQESSFETTMQTAMEHLDVNEKLLLSFRDYLYELELCDEKVHKVIGEFYTTSSDIIKYLKQAIAAAEDREQFWKTRYENENNTKNIIEESLRVLALENNELESTLPASKTASPGPFFVTEEEEFFDAVELVSTSTVTLVKEISQKRLVDGVLMGYPKQFRKSFIIKSTDIPPISVWGILKNAIGKDLSRIPMPVNLNEPLSMLQRMCEDMEYSDLLTKASKCADQLHRIQFVAAFAMSNYSSTENRTTKPFNPLLGETFEFVSDSGGFRYLSEQVSHHPPIGVCHCESDDFLYWSEVRVKTKFWGKSFEIVPEGVSHVILKGFPSGNSKYIEGEHYSWKKVTTCVNNIIVGKLWIDHYGDMLIKNHSTGDTLTLTFKAAGWRGNNAKKIEGTLIEAKCGNEIFSLEGFWNISLHSSPISTTALEKKELWRRKPLPDSAATRFNFTEFTFSLNESNDELKMFLPPTDSRLRPDQQAMEEGNLNLANNLKNLLEDRQRAVRKLREKEKAVYAPRWFTKEIDPDTNEPHWTFDKSYWTRKLTKEWGDLDTIFSVQSEDDK